MLAVAAAQLGYRTHVLAPDAESVAAQTASSFTRADYHSRIVLDEFAAAADVVTYEFENIALEPIDYLVDQGAGAPRRRPRSTSRRTAPREKSVRRRARRPHRAVAQGRRRSPSCAPRSPRSARRRS